MLVDKDRSGIEEKFFELCSKVVTAQCLSIYDLEYVRTNKLLRVYIINEKTNTAVIEECVEVDRAMSPYFESEDWIPEEIVLEVSSPGLFRKLKTRKHFERVIGSNIELVVKKNPEGIKNKKFQALLDVVLENKIGLTCETKTYEISFENIKKANLLPSINLSNQGKKL